ncbi:hypothetical protein R1flu_010515 [Riccia fluitans]|uniref:Uncharacterized protein n=1 Tax=Riccia fluitans TaxID=41844 RepID=A0ABD1Z571_9MARC
MAGAGLDNTVAVGPTRAAMAGAGLHGIGPGNAIGAGPGQARPRWHQAQPDGRICMAVSGRATRPDGCTA